jgi:hypothetical protein
MRVAQSLKHVLHHYLFSLRGRLLLGVVVIWTLLSMTLLAFGWQSGTLLVEESNRVHLRYEAELIRNDITHEIEQRLEVLERLAGLYPDASPGMLARGNHDPLLALFEGLILVDAENIVVDDWPTLEGRRGQDIGYRSYARFMRNVQRPHVSEPFVGAVSGKPMVMMLVPRHTEQGRYTGFVGGLVEIARSELFEGFQRLRLGDEGHVVIATASGRLLYHPDQRQDLPTLEDVARDPWLDLARDGWQGEASGNLLGSSAGLTAYRQIWPADWILGLYLPLDQVYTPPGKRHGAHYVAGLVGVGAVAADDGGRDLADPAATDAPGPAAQGAEPRPPALPSDRHPPVRAAQRHRRLQ